MEAPRAFGKPLPIHKVTITVSLLEASMIRKLREYEFGQFTIYKNAGQPNRIVIGGSEMLNEQDGMEIAENILD